MNDATQQAAQRLAEEFSDAPLTTVRRIVADCDASADPRAYPGEAERRARDRLTALPTWSERSSG